MANPPIPPNRDFTMILEHGLAHGDGRTDFVCLLCSSTLRTVTSLEAVHHYTEHLRTRALAPSVIEWLRQNLPRVESDADAPATTTLQIDDHIESALTQPLVGDSIDRHESTNLASLHPNDIEDVSTTPDHGPDYDDDMNIERQSDRSMTTGIDDAIPQSSLEEPEDVLYLNPLYHSQTEY